MFLNQLFSISSFHLASCPKERQVWCRSSVISDCLKTCGVPGFIMSPEHKCTPYDKDPACKMYCNCENDKAFDNGFCVDCVTTGKSNSLK